ncbi:MAG: hypothetical protein K9K82_08535 [Desulfobacteraceae bacterium]|nr:hypothetical protein [Desulfobacteraceae bacterium]
MQQDVYHPVPGPVSAAQHIDNIEKILEKNSKISDCYLKIKKDYVTCEKRLMKGFKKRNQS